MLSRFSLGIPLLALFVALAGDAAAGLIQISYTVTGGTFNGPNSSGAITGGNLSFRATTLGSNELTSDTSNPVEPVPALLTKLTLNGPSGFFRFSGGGTGTGMATFTQLFASFTQMRTNPSIRTGAVTGAADYQFAGASASGGMGTGTVIGTVGTAMFAHNFTIGSEVRSVVPEPGTGLLLGMGLSALAVAGRIGRSRLRARRAAAR